jgi:hypothetical protein
MAAAPENTYRMAIVGGLTPALGFSAHLPENRGEGFIAGAVLTIGQRRPDHLRGRVRATRFCVAGIAEGMASLAEGMASLAEGTASNVCACERRPRRRQNFSGNGATDEKVSASMASRAISRAAGAVVASMPVTNCQILLRPVMRGLPLDRKILARHLPGFCSKASTTNPRYSMRPPPEYRRYRGMTQE